MTFADALRPSVIRMPHRMLLYHTSLLIGGSLLVGLSAQLALRLPLSPIPITGQTLAVLLVGALLGSRRGALAILLYLFEGALGLPVFAGGMSGLPYLMGPSGGYLMGFVGAALVTGFLAERAWDRHVPSTALAMFLGNLVIYLFGLPWLACFVGVDKVLPLGLHPFIVGDAMKLALAVTLLPSGWKMINGRGPRQV